MRRLSELPAEDMARLLCALTAPMCRIAEDEQVTALLERLMRMETRSAADWTALLKEAAALMQGRCADDLWMIAALITGTEAAQLRRLGAAEAFRLLRSVWDEALLDFFSCAGSTEGTPS